MRCSQGYSRQWLAFRAFTVTSLRLFPQSDNEELYAWEEEQLKSGRA